jgi:replication-associated recombination protein RarA
MLPSIRLFEREGGRHEAGWEALRGFLDKRIGGSANLERLFGAADPEGHNPLAESLIENSGGDFRTLLNLVREILLRANRTAGLPVSEALADEACAAVRSQMLPVPVEEARRLQRVAERKTDILETDEREEVDAVTRLLDSHRLLFLKNGGEWYDVHPLIREEVAETVRRNSPAE